MTKETDDQTQINQPSEEVIHQMLAYLKKTSLPRVLKEQEEQKNEGRERKT